MLAALEQSLEHERRFVDDASHELRTPLTLLTSRIQLARRRPRTVEEHEAVLDELAVDVDPLVDLAEQLLALGAPGPAPAGAADVSDVRVVVRDLVARRRLARPDLAPEVALGPAPTAVRAAIDGNALERILTNLLDNAARHGAPPVGLRVRTVASDSGGAGWAVVEVSDAGPGMPPDLLGRATERFTRSAEARSRPGAGLGLSIVEQLLRRAHGELRLCCHDVHSSHGRATPEVRCDHSTSMTATVILPRA